MSVYKKITSSGYTILPCQMGVKAKFCDISDINVTI